MAIVCDVHGGDDTLPRVTVAIPTKDRSGLLSRVVQDLLAQDYPRDRFDILVVDDGSRDNTVDVIRLSERESAGRVRLISQNNQGFAGARNTAVANLTGAWIAFIDDDMEIPPTWLRELAGATLRHPDAMCVGGRIRLRYVGKQPRFCGRETIGDELDLGEDEREVDTVFGGNFMFRGDSYDYAGPFLLAGRGDEEEWQKRLREAGGRIVYVPEAWLWHLRLPEDMRFVKVVRTRFRHGREQVRYLASIDARPAATNELKDAVLWLVHWVKRRCFAGLVLGCMRLGRVWELAVKRQPRGRVAKPTRS